ncbi:MAG: phosphatidylglycerophosphatase A [Desulfobacteraceae bacterium]|nr:phosphatidylglycerophosphatase A [Desulfobacteraceae bacterium]MCB9495182.1 phosphatidylglycerophosphatase A [Desulfobacteraceae bacterium]
MSFNFEKIILFFAMGGYSGKAPFSPGTAGTLCSIPFVAAVSFIPSSFSVVFISFFILFSVYVSDKASEILENKDPKEVVIDEFAGFLVTMSGIGISFYSLFCGFLLFRFFDILKPWPIKNAEKAFKGGSGIVFDDIIAGIFANLILRLIL